jgi:uncharacterized membrane protein
VPKNRLEAFSDGIFAFAATLLILNLMVNGVSLGPELLQIWTSYVAYAVSFITIGIIWINHHTLMHQIAHVNRLFLVFNVFFLMMIAFIPFPTRLLALYVNDPKQAEAAAVAYGVTLTLTALFINVLWRYAASGRRLLRENADARVVEGISRSYLPGPFIYLAGTAVALVSPRGSALIYVGIAAFYVLESSIFGGQRRT